MAELGGPESESEDMSIRLKDYPSFSSAFQATDLLSKQLLAKVIGNVVMGLDNLSLLHLAARSW